VNIFLYIIWWYLLNFGSIACINTITTNDFLRAAFNLVCNKHVLAHWKVFKNFLTTIWTTVIGWEMTSQLIRWSADETVSVQCSSHEYESFPSLYNVTVVLSISMIFLHSSAIICISSSDNNPTYAGNTVNYQKCWYRSRLGPRQMLIMTKQWKRESKETSVVEAKVTICPYELRSRNWQDSFLQDSLPESLQVEKFCVSSFWSYCKVFIFKIPASGTRFQNTVFLPSSAKLTVKYQPGRWNTGHLATLA